MSLLICNATLTTAVVEPCRHNGDCPCLVTIERTRWKGTISLHAVGCSRHDPEHMEEGRHWRKGPEGYVEWHDSAHGAKPHIIGRDDDEQSA